MNKRILFIALVALQSWTLVWAASYRLQLKNGNEIKTSHYWEEGDEIKFYFYGGIAGIQKGFVSGVAISKSNFIEQGKDSRVLDGSISSEGIKTQHKENEDKSDEEAGNAEVSEMKYYSERKATLKEKLTEALENNREATHRKDQEAKKATREEMRKYSQQLHDLEDELKEKNNGNLPDWWKE